MRSTLIGTAIFMTLYIAATMLVDRSMRIRPFEWCLVAVIYFVITEFLRRRAFARRDNP